MKNQLFVVLGLALLAVPVLARGGGHHSSSHSYSSHRSSSHSSSSPGRHYTHTYTTKRGTVVKGHYSTNANGHFRDNWSTKGNRNPVTGKAGTKVTGPHGEAQ